IRSASGRLNVGEWKSLDSENILGGDWRESNPTQNALTELKPVGLGTFLGSSVIDLGQIYDPLSSNFLTGDDLVFDYATPDGTIVPGQIVYTGTTVNNLLLQVDPISGE